MVLKNLNEEQRGKTFVFLIRHGETEKTEGNVSNPDRSLNKEGLKQAKEIARKFAKRRDEIDIFYSSSMNRALQTADEISSVIKRKTVRHNALREFNQILWSRKYYHYKFWKHWLKHKRSIIALNEILEKHRGKVILIVAHGNLIKGILGNKIGLPLRKLKHFNYDHAQVSLLRFNGTKLEKIYYFNSKEISPLV